MIYFVSDVHIGFYKREIDREREDLFLNFLKKIRGQCSELILVGDIFDYWFDYKTVIPKDFYRTLDALKSLTDEGIKITYLMGNHDFGHYRFFRDEMGIEVLEEDISRRFGDKKFYISHGDGKIPGEIGYRILKKILRSKINQCLFRKFFHPDFAIALASGSSRKSRRYSDAADIGVGLDKGMKDYAFKKIDEGYDYVIFGHRHKPEIIEMGKGKYITLGDWLKNYSYGSFDGEKFRLHRVDGAPNIENLPEFQL